MSSSRRPSNDQRWSPLLPSRLSSPSASVSSNTVDLGLPPRQRLRQTRGSRRVVSTGSIPFSQEDPFITTGDRSSRTASAGQLPGSYPDIPTWSITPPASNNHSWNNTAHDRNTPGEVAALDDSPGPRLSASVPTTPTPSPSAPSLRPSPSPLSRRSRATTVSPSPSPQPESLCEWTASRLDAEIERTIRLRLSERERAETSLGNNYIFEAVLESSSYSSLTTSPIRDIIAAAASPPRTAPQRLLKIGYTQRTEHARMTQIRKTCSLDVSLRHIPSTPSQTLSSSSSSSGLYDVEEDDVPVRLFRRVEKLVHAELAAYQYRFTCVSCGRQHREYFADVDPALARAVQDRWRRWAAQEPYDFDGKLLPFWEARLRQRRRTCPRPARASSEPVGAAAASEDEIGRRSSSSWDEFASPFWLEKAWYDAGVVLGRVWACRWQFSTLAMALVLALVCFPSLLAFSCFVLAAAGFVIETQFHESLYSLSGLLMVKRWLIARRT